MWREDFEVDGLAIDALVVAGDPCRLVFNFPLDIAKVVEPPVRDVVELGPFVPVGLIGMSVANVHDIIRIVAGDVDQLQDEGSPRDDAAATGQEISADDVLEYRGLSRGLGPNDDLQSASKISTLEAKRGGAAAVVRTICGRSRESFPIVLKTRSCSLFTVANKSSPSAAMATVVKG